MSTIFYWYLCQGREYVKYSIQCLLDSINDGNLLFCDHRTKPQYNLIRNVPSHFNIGPYFSKYHRNGQNSFCCSLTQLNPSSRFTNILIITDQRMRDDERDCAVMFYMQHRSNMYIIEYDPLEEKDMVYWVREEFNHIKVSLQTDRHTALPFVEGKNLVYSIRFRILPVLWLGTPLIKRSRLH